MLLIAAALALALLIKAFLFQAFYIPSESMVPTLKKNDRVLVNKLSYKLHDVHRGDIVVFERAGGRGRRHQGSRQAGHRAARRRDVAFRDGIVYINGDAARRGLPPGRDGHVAPVARLRRAAEVTVPPNTSG